MKYDKLIFEQGTDKFVIGYYGSDLYWIMTHYHENNKFVITKEHYKLYGFLKNMFQFMKQRAEPQLKSNVFSWISEARRPEESNHMTITKLKGKFVVEFFQNPNDYISIASKTCAICFCLSGSRNWALTSMFSYETLKILAGD